jgi:hypothetical protein
MTEPLIDTIYKQMQDENKSLVRRLNDTRQTTERGETVGGFESFTYATAPRAAQGGMSNGDAYVDVCWVKDGRKPGEGVGAGTGVVAVYDAGLDDWLRVGDYAVVTT